MFREKNAVLYKEAAGKQFYYRIFFDEEQQQITTYQGEFGAESEINHSKITSEQNYKTIIQEQVTKKEEEGYKNLVLDYLLYTTSKVVFTCQHSERSSSGCLDLETMFDNVMLYLANHLEKSGFGRISRNDDSSDSGNIFSEYNVIFHDYCLDINQYLLTQLENHKKLLDHIIIVNVSFEEIIPYYPK